MKLYDSKEVRAILRIAAEKSAADEPDNKMGLSIDELRQLASEAGIDPEQITRAAAEIEANSRINERNFWGGPFSYSPQVLVDGEITLGQWEEMLLSIREFFQSKGKVTTRNSVYEWSSPWDTSNSAHVTALKNNGQTKINLNWHGPLTALPYYLPVPLVAITSLLFASGFLELTAIPGIAFTLLATGLAFLAGRWKLRKNLDKGFKKLRQMVTDLEIIASRKSPESELDIMETHKRDLQDKTDNPLKNILIEENPDNPDIQTTSRNRSKT
ncbi:MAG: hypothetical protein RI573_14605 [Balneolaceae bacterium]|nr:hypothetical protein [Balneolaceae bacterium]